MSQYPTLLPPRLAIMTILGALGVLSCGTDEKVQAPKWQISEPCQGKVPCIGVEPGIYQGDPQAHQSPLLPAGMALVPEGPFLMGTSNDFLTTNGLTGEYPAHEVYLSTYAMDVYEVTVQEYRRCVEQGACQPVTLDYEQCNWQAPERAQHPINCISWFQAKAYCEWAGKSLPTEAQWEKAARGPDATIQPWGNEPLATCDRAIITTRYTHEPGCGTGYTWPIGSRPLGVSIYGTHDLAGNVAEWCSDYAQRNYYSVSEYRDPQGPSEGDYRSVRGAHFAESPISVFPYSSQREADPPDEAWPWVGVRCVKNL